MKTIEDSIRSLNNALIELDDLDDYCDELNITKFNLELMLITFKRMMEY